MAQEAERFDGPDSAKVSERRSDAYVVLTLLPPEWLAWLLEQRLRVADSISSRATFGKSEPQFQ